MATYIKPNAIKDASIEGIKIKDGAISSSKIDETVASKSYVDTQVKTVDDKTVALEAKEITYSELKALRDAGKLIPGTQYRITDYQCTTTQENTQSAGHQFDIIVKADSENKLNEEANAIQHTEDDIDYFANSDLSAWKLWYCLDNDTNRFGWADSTNGKGVIYRMIDEWNNDVPYDFKNIQFKHPNDTTTYPYYYYTFASDNVEDNTDYSLSIANNCYSNVIKEYVKSGKRTLNQIIFIGSGCYSNTFGNNCTSNTFGNYCNINTFGNNCTSNTFGDYCYINTFGNNCTNNTFRNICDNNTFGNYCSRNAFGEACSNNVFGKNCNDNVFGDYCSSNTFGNNCSYIKFAPDTSATTKYNYYQNNHFGDGCQYIVFTGAGTASNVQQVQNYNFAQGLQGTRNAYLTINGKRNRTYETYISKDTYGTIKESVIADTASKQEANTFAQNQIFTSGITFNRTSSGGPRFTDIDNKTIRATLYGSNDSYANIEAAPGGPETSLNSVLTVRSLTYPLTIGGAWTFGSYPTMPGIMWGDELGMYVSYEANTSLLDVYSRKSERDGIALKGISKVLNDNTSITNKEYVDTQVKLANNAVQITYSDLKSLRDAGKLVPGTQYRITDYTCTTAQEDTRSAGHQFDIIVTADSMNKLNENARAIQHTDDTYFANSKLESWELKYCLDNDTTRFAWADETNGKGVIYRMKDEYDNECPYDFKNIQFKRYAVTNVTSTTLTSDALNKLKNILVKNSNGGLYFATKDSDGSFVPSNANGASYEIDETDSNWYYTFQGIGSDDGSTINKMYDLTVETFKLTNECISFLEGNGSGADTEDYCRENKIEQFNQEYFVDNLYYKGRQILNNIVFIGGLNYCYQNEYSNWEYNTSSIYGNRFGVNCNSNTFGNSCYSNTFGNYCAFNTFGNYCNHNTFGNIFQYNTFGNDCYANTFGNGCYGNTFGNHFIENTFGNDCYANTFGNDYYINTFGNNCYGNTFGNDCYGNIFGNGCSENTFGNNCYINTFGNNCYINTFGNNCYGNTFGNDCYGNIFGNKCYRNTFGNNCNSNTFGNDCQYNSFGNGCGSNTFGSDYGSNTFGNDCWSNTFGNYIQESQFGDGVQYFSITTQQMTTSPTSSYTKNYIRWLIVENGVRYVNAYVTDSTSSSSQCQNVRICLGIQGTSSGNRKAFDITSCIGSTVNNVYQPTNSQTTSV